MIEVLPPPSQFPVQEQDREGVRVWCIGVLHGASGDVHRTITQALTEGGVLRPFPALDRALAALSGNFSCIIRDRQGTILFAVDKIRSYPLFWSAAGGRVRVSADPYALKDALPTTPHDREALLELRMAGYVTGGATTITDLHQLQAGQYAVVVGTTVTVRDAYLFFDSSVRDTSVSDAIATLHDVTTDIFRRLIGRLNGRPAWVPLSGGLDSRLILCLLKECGYDNIQTFSYGVPNNCEAAAAKVIAARVGVPWFFVPYTRAFGRRIYATDERRRYFRFSHELTGISMMTDFYALHELSGRGRISNDAVIINGQTGDFISGGHIPAALDRPEVSRDVVFDAIIRKHYGLWIDVITPTNVELMKGRIARVLGDHLPPVLPQATAMKYHERWEWCARQAQHVVAGQRVYDFFGRAWELPLWDDAYLRFWSVRPFAEKYRQALYRAYLTEKDFFGVFRLPFRRYTPPRWAQWASVACSVFGSRQNNLRRIYLQYWQKYTFFYAKDSYRTYRRYARHHRNPSSVLAADLLREEYGVSL